MLEPSGDAHHAGRIIDGNFERGISLACAEELKKQIVKFDSNIRVILTRVPGEVLEPLQNASFANRLAVDLYLSLYFYEEKKSPQHVTLFYYLENKTTDFWHQPNLLSFYPAHQAYLLNLQTTKKWADAFFSILTNKTNNPFFQAAGLFGIPFKPLIGITCPALSLEIGLKDIKDWKYIIEPILTFIEFTKNDI